MHAVHLPPRDLWRSAALALLLALVFTLLLLTKAGQLSLDRSLQVSTPQAQLAVPPAAPAAAHPSRNSSLLKPLATPAPLLQASRAD